jgi:hypothetical protein
MKPFSAVASVVFAGIALFHLLRITSHWQITIKEFIVPQWVSIPGFLVASLFAFMLWKEAKK